MVCKNWGCGLTYKHIENPDKNVNKCTYHPGCY